MAIEFNDNIHVKINRPTDFRFGPFISIAQANATIPIAQRYHGLIFGVYTTPLSIATSDIIYYYYWNGLSNTDIKQLGGKPPVDGSYANQAAMIAAQATQTAQYIYYDGTSYWEYLGTTNGNISDYREINNSITNPITGTGVAGQVSFWNGTSTQTGDSGLVWDNVNKVLSIPSGSVSNPSLVFGADTNTGFYRNAENVVGISAGGIGWLFDSASFSSGTVLIRRSGANSATSPDYSFATPYSNTGIFRPSGLSEIAFSLAGIERVRVKSTGLGILTDSPTNTLDVNGTGRIRNGVSLADTSGNVQIGTLTDAGFRLDVNGTARVQGQTTLRGAGNTSATTALLIQNSASSAIGTFRDDRSITLTSGTGTLNINTAGAGDGIIDFDINSSATQTVFLQLTRGTLGFGTSSTQTGVQIAGGFSPTSGTGVWNTLRLNPTINQTGGASNVTRGLLISPTLTSAADWRSIETSNNTGYAAYFAGTADLFFNDATDLQFGTTTGTKIGTSTSQKLGFWNATPIVQPANTVAINDVLVNVGLRASGGISNFTSSISTTGNVEIGGQAYSPVNAKGNSGTGTVTFNWNDGNIQSVTLTGSCTFAFSNPQSGASYQIIIIQDGTGSWTITWPTIHWQGKVVPSLTGTANSKDILTITYDGTNYNAVMAKNFGTP